MSGEYQLRKDIDDIQRRIDNIKSELIANGVITEDTSVEEFNSILGTIISTVSDLENVDGKLDGLETVIGDSTTGLIKQVNDIDDTVGDNDSGLVKTVNGHTTSIGGLNTTVSGHTSSISSLNTTVGDNSSGLVKDVNDLNSDVQTLDGVISNIDGSIIEQNTTISHISRNLDKYHLPSVSMDWTYVFGSSINMDDVYDLEDVDGIPRLEYAYKVENGQWYERHSDSSFITTQGSPSNPIGVCNELPSQTVSGSSLSFYTYEVSTMNYYAYSSNNWVEQTDLSDFFTKTNVYNNIDSDFTTQTDFDVLDGQINDTNGIADTVDSLDTSVGNLETTVGDNSSGLVKDVNDLDTSVGTVDVEITGDLQTQVLKLIRSLSDLVSFVNFVDSFNECSIGTFSYNGVTYNQVSAEYPYDYIYNTNTSKYYQKKLFGDKYGWDEYQDPLYAKFNSTHLYEVLIQYFSQSGHTHTKSNITDFTHQHTSFDLTDSPYQLVQIIPTIRVLIKVYSNGWNVYITYENTENQQMVMGTNTSYAFPILVEEPYRPANRYVYSNITHQGNMGVYGAVHSDGTIYIINRSTATSFGVYGSISYPLKAKMISATGNYSHIDINQSTDFERLTPSTATTSSAIDSATLFSQLTDGTNPVLKENVDITFKKDGTTLDTVTTDENGVASYTYTADGSGVHTFTATDGTITSSDYTVTDWLLYDNGLLDDYNEDIYYNYNNRNSVSRDANGTTLTAITGSNGIYVLNPNGLTSTTLSDYNYFDSFTLEFDFVNRQGTSSSTAVTLYLADSSARSVAFNTLGINNTGHCKIVYDGSSLKVWMDGTQTYNQSITTGTKRVGFATGTSSQSGYLKFKNLRIYGASGVAPTPTPTVDSVSLTSDKNIVSQYHSESATLTATVLDTNSSPMENATVEFFNGSTSLGTASTDSSGVATKSYSANANGDVSLSAVCDGVSSSPVTVEDCWYYDPTEISYTSSSTVVETAIISSLFNINNQNFVMEFDIKSNGTGGGLNIGDTTHYSPPSTANYRIYIGTDTSKFSFNNRTTSSSNTSVGSVTNDTYYHMKLTKSGTSFTGYYGATDTSIATKTASWISNYSSWALYWTNWKNTNYVKNIKIKFV